MRLLLILFALLAASMFATAQDKPAAVMIDQFEQASCDDMNSRVQHLATVLANDPGSVGYIVIYPKAALPFRPYFGLEENLRGSVIFLQLTSLPITFVQGEKRNEQKIEFWVVPAGSQKPDFPVAVWSYPISKPKKIYDTNWPLSEVCSEAPVERLASILTANPTLRSHISITERSDRKYRTLLSEIKTKLISVDASRLRFFRRRDCSAACGRYQLWLVP
jgi:hypothetical protein